MVIAMIRKLGRDMRMRRLERTSISEEEYFARFLRELGHTRSQILMEGYDSGFMERPPTMELINAIIEGRGYISAIVPHNVETYLERLAVESPYVSLLRTDNELRQGYMILDRRTLFTWDMDTTTFYPPEKSRGVPYREFLTSRVNYGEEPITRLEKKFRAAEREARTEMSVAR